MKKNLISVIILALVFANFVLTAILMFTVLPQAKQANTLIEKVCAAIDLELNSGAVTGTSNVPMDKIEDFSLTNGEALTINLTADEDGKAHYVVLEVSFSMNKESDGYKTYGAEGLTAKQNIIKNDVIAIVRSYTKSEIDDGTEDVQKEILERMQDMFGADFIVGVNFSKITTE